jgi:hypothetical protein
MKRTFKVEISSPERIPKKKNSPGVLKYLPIAGLYFASERDLENFQFTIYQLVFFLGLGFLIGEIIYLIETGGSLFP